MAKLLAKPLPTMQDNTLSRTCHPEIHLDGKQAGGMEQTHPASESFDINLIDKNAINYNFGNHYGTVDLGLAKVLTQPPIIPVNSWLYILAESRR